MFLLACLLGIPLATVSRQVGILLSELKGLLFGCATFLKPICSSPDLIQQTAFDQVRPESPLVTIKRLYAKYKFQRHFSPLSAKVRLVMLASFLVAKDILFPRISS
jgi:hypothetical protein